MTLTHDQARAFYDRLGAKQDWQRFYEAPAQRELIDHAALPTARAVFEFGCGTGRFAETLLHDDLPANALYRAVDVSSTMVSLARTRLARFGERAQVALATGEPILAAEARTFDRFISIYVLDLLSNEETSSVVAEAHRILRDGGLAGFISLTHGFTLASRFVERLWTILYAWRPAFVGGCRPISLLEFLRHPQWVLEHHTRISSFGVPSEVVVARKIPRSPAAV